VIRKWTILAVLLMLTLAMQACAPATVPPAAQTAPPTAAPTKAPAAAPTKAAEPTKPPAPTPSPVPASLKFGTTGALGYAGVYVGIEKGFFKEQGIDVELVNFRAVGEMIGPISTGQIDFAGTPVSSALLAAADRGIELKVAASGTQDISGRTTFWAALRKDLADSGRVKTPADLKGMKIAIASPGGISKMLVDLMLEEGGLKPTDVELVSLPFADQIPAFANKAIDVGIAADPFLSQGIQQGVSVKWIPDHKYFDGKCETAFMVFSPQLAKNKDVAQRWMVAYLKGVRAYLDGVQTKAGREEIVNILIKYTPVKDAKLYDYLELPYMDPNGVPDKKSVDKQNKWLLDSGEYKGKMSLGDMTDLSFAEYASQRLGKR